MYSVLHTYVRTYAICMANTASTRVLTVNQIYVLVGIYIHTYIHMYAYVYMCVVQPREVAVHTGSTLLSTL